MDEYTFLILDRVQFTSLLFRTNHFKSFRIDQIDLVAQIEEVGLNGNPQLFDVQTVKFNDFGKSPFLITSLKMLLEVGFDRESHLHSSPSTQSSTPASPEMACICRPGRK